MSGKYVPPGRRKPAEEQLSPPKQDEGLVSLEDIKLHFSPSVKGEAGHVSKHDLEGTLHDSTVTRGQLAYVVLFAGANPRWDSDQIIFTKSNLDLLPSASSNPKMTSSNQSQESDKADRPVATDSCGEAGDNDDLAKTASGPIAVFKQIDVGVRRGRGFKFDGWYRIERIQLLEPNTAELAKMLKEKWSFTDSRGNSRQKQRDPIMWKKSLGQRWAVVKLQKDELAEKNRGTPKIEKQPERKIDDAAKKSVNEMLAELRMEDEFTKESNETVAG